jgi:hypothetical protein
MPFVHSLAKTEMAGKAGWCAPIELGEAAPHYVSFVVPLDQNDDFFSAYTCEMITADARGSKRIEPHDFVRQGKDSFVLRLGNLELWFTVRTVLRQERRLPYVGKLGHEDFALLFTEVEPEEPDRLDLLYDETGTFVIGCDPLTLQRSEPS